MDDRRLLFCQFLLSGRRESDSDYKHPMLAYYHYTTARLLSAGIEPTSAPSEGAILSVERREVSLD